MPVTVEDGSIVAGADSYVSEADFAAYAASLGWTINNATEEVDLRRAAMFIDRQYTYLGRRVSADQAMEWPRYIDESVNGFSVASDSIPGAIKNAQMEVAYLFNQGNDLFAYSSEASVKRKREKVDVIEEETEYFTGSDVQSRILSIEGLLRGYISGGQPGQTATIVRLVRG